MLPALLHIREGGIHAAPHLSGISDLPATLLI
jgi:hypothetical protein